MSKVRFSLRHILNLISLSKIFILPPILFSAVNYIEMGKSRDEVYLYHLYGGHLSIFLRMILPGLFGMQCWLLIYLVTIMNVPFDVLGCC